MKYINKIITLIVTFTLLAGCQTETKVNKDDVPPAQITDVTYVPTNGGAIFSYTIPEDSDFLYVRAEYVTDAGKTVSKTSSVYTKDLEIVGLGTVREYEVKLYSVDHESNESEPVIVSVTPLEANVFAVANSLKIIPGFSALAVNLENPTQDPVDIFVTIKTAAGQSAQKVQTSTAAKDRYFIQQLNAEPYAVSAYVQDSYGNKSDVKDFGSLTPLEDYELDKKQFTFLRDQLLYGTYWDEATAKPTSEVSKLYVQDSLKNAKEINYEGNISKFFNGLTDADPTYSLDYFHSGVGYPFSYFIDLGREVKVSRIRIWPRLAQAWVKYSVKTFEIYISNDKTPEDGILTDWEYVGRYTRVKPTDETEANLEAKEGSAFWAYPDDPHFTRPFRYVRFKAVQDFDGGTIACMSEITFYGNEAND